jgi:hypothetical protein
MVMAMFEFVRQTKAIPMKALEKQFLEGKIGANERLREQIKEVYFPAGSQEV